MPVSAPETVVLIDDSGRPCGTAPKLSVHGSDTPLHLAFSCHVVREGRVLVTRRALSKRTFPGVWTNAFCGHPAPGEAIPDAVRRRGRRELGLHLQEPTLVLPEFRYRATDASGVVENELCPVFIVETDADPVPEPDEADDWAWVEPDALVAAVRAAPFAFSPWLALQLEQWADYPAVPPAS